MIIVDGVVGVGKSTLMNILAEERNMVPFQEPVVDNPVLEKFYHDRERYSFPLQTFFLNKRFEHIKKASSLKNAILDRSIYGDVIFAKMLNDTKEMSDEEFDIYNDLFHHMLKHIQAPKLMVYLEISVDNAIDRIKKRGRDYELIVEREYWERLNMNYTNYFANYNFSPILKINVDNIDFENNLEDRKYVLSVINEALNKIESGGY
ncbi:deoxynucleoside kinase [Oceanirhabdus sp. W0125-5]|uniref:deoxynucleoside kinase n=1 Tax=Oceanirhabdus sp. W0125-5 TaxID=2999116 RepID=UPI0022F2B5D2|nr:deoxynucleoside kinase [Oceanirhabdus sp. W0125-5]WBW97533.1 deoxynucleoside kinase [Oceanirhabdus sp. W0125-5]